MTDRELVFLGAAILMAGRINEGGGNDSDACAAAVYVAKKLLECVEMGKLEGK
jgi:hypothetical protein